MSSILHERYTAEVLRLLGPMAEQERAVRHVEIDVLVAIDIPQV